MVKDSSSGEANGEPRKKGLAGWIERHSHSRALLLRAYSRESDHLRILQILYAIWFTLGLKEVAEYLVKVRPVPWLAYVAAVALGLLGLRLFYSVEALGQHILVVADRRGTAGAGLATPDPRFLILLYFILLVQAALFFSCCLMFKPTAETAARYGFRGTGFALECAVTLLVNSGWLGLLVWRSRRLTGGSNQGPEAFWAWNNLLFGMSIVIIAFLCGEPLLGEISRGGAWLVVGALLVNSGLDLGFAAPFYGPVIQARASSCKGCQGGEEQATAEGREGEATPE